LHAWISLHLPATGRGSRCQPSAGQLRDTGGYHLRQHRFRLRESTAKIPKKIGAANDSLPNEKKSVFLQTQ
jgi:hypothetical protein